jgi:hypothetical protein
VGQAADRKAPQVPRTTQRSAAKQGSSGKRGHEGVAGLEPWA